MLKYTLCNVSSDFRGYQELINLYSSSNGIFLQDLELSFDVVFSANLCAVLGAVLDKLKADKLIDIKFGNIPINIEEILQQNNFLSYYGFTKLLENNQSTISYLKLRPTDSRYFNTYITKELINHPELSNLNTTLKKKITESIYEIFVNAQIHSESDFIYTCGQFFPKKYSMWVTIVDLGVGFKTKMNKRFGREFSATQSILWAIQNGHTTKTNISGGIGLALLKEFIGYNHGEMQIISGNGFYSFNSDGENVFEFEGEFPGTIISMKFKTDDDNSYSIASKLNSDEIF